MPLTLNRIGQIALAVRDVDKARDILSGRPAAEMAISLWRPHVLRLQRGPATAGEGKRARGSYLRLADLLQL